MAKRDISEMTNQELERELQRRKRKKEAAARPRVVAKIDLTNLIEITESHISNLSRCEERDDDKQYIYEAAMIAIYGPDVFDWINSKL